MTLMPNDPNGIPSILDTPDMRRQAMWDALGGIGMGLIQAGAPSPYPQNALGAFGMAMQGAQSAMNEDKYLKRAMVNMQAQKLKQEMDADARLNDLFAGGGQQQAAPPVAQQGVPSSYANSIAGIESGGRYDALGPHVPGQGQAHGKYQVMPANIGPWTKEILGQELTPAQFLASPQAQDAVFNAKFGQYVKQYGPEGAARAWFAGPGGVNNPNATDVNGMTAGRYGQQFAQAAGVKPGMEQGGGEGQPVQVAQYSPQAYRPQTMQDVINSMPEGMRMLARGMDRKGKLELLAKYADPGNEQVIDTQTGQVVFVPKTVVGRDPRFQPVEGEKLNIERRKVQLEAANKPVSETGVVNEPYVTAQTRISAAQGTDPSSKIDLKLAEDAIARNKDWQNSGVLAQSTVANLDTFKKLTESVKTGQFKGTTTDLKAKLKGMGFNLESMGIPDDVGPAQAMQMLTQRSALDLRQQMPGAMSDGDRKFVVDATMSIDKDPNSNAIMAEIMRGQAQRNIDRAKFANDYIRSKAFKTDPAGIDEYVNQRLAEKSYFDASVLPKPPEQGSSVPPPPAGYRTPGTGAAPGGIPAPPNGFKVIGR